MNRSSFFVFFFLFAVIVTYSNATETNGYKTEFYNVGSTVSIPEEAAASISATITGTTTVCRNTARPNITFTGSGGTAPYKFTYHINGGNNLTVTTTAGKDSVSIGAATTAPGIFVYTLTNVSTGAFSQPLNKQATVTVTALPGIDFTYTDQQCSGTGVLFTPSLTGTYSYAWNFGDGTTSTRATPTHLFTGSGSGTQDYVVKLTQTDTITSCQDTVSKHVVVSQVPDATLNGSGYGLIYNGLPGFRICSNDNSATFIFSNVSMTAGTNSRYTINWGDGTPDFKVATWTSTTHTYQAGYWILSYTVEGSTGCKYVKKYYVFVGSNPAVTLGNPGNTNICISQTLTFPITGTENNSKGTTYTVSFNDGAPDEVYVHPAPLQITHKFLKSSCGVTSSDGSTIYQNSFFAKITASNPCGPSASSVMPIYVSVPPTADFILPVTNTCANTQIRLTNSSKNGNAINGGSCSSNPNLIWRITPTTGFTLKSGSFGTDFGSTDPSLWSSGSNAIDIVFTIPQVYTISMKIGNRCDIDSIQKTICVVAPLNPKFSLPATQGCAPFNVTVTNQTDTLKTCSPSYKWTVGYTPTYCGTISGYTFAAGTNATSSNPSFQFTNPGIYSIQLTTTNSCGTQSIHQDVTVTRPPEVSIDSIPSFCGQASVHPVARVSSCAPVPGAISYAWSFPGGSPGSSIALDPGIIAYNSTGSYTVSLTVTNDCGASATAIRTFSVRQVPTITNVDLAQTLCSGQKTDPVTLTSDFPAATYSWTATATPGITGFVTAGTSDTLPAARILNSTANLGTVTFSITPSLGGCAGEVVHYVVTVNPAPIISNQPKSFEICVGGIPDTLSVVATNGLGTTPTYQWYRNTVNDNTTGSPIGGAINATYAPPADIVDTLFYYCVVTYSSGLCPSIPSETARVIVGAYPVVSNYSLELNSGETLTFMPNTLNGDIIPAGTMYTWPAPVISSPNSITGASSQSTPQVALKQTLTSTTVSPVTATYTVTPVSGLCKGADFNVTVTVIHPLAPNIIQKNISCFGVHDGSLQTAIEGGVPFKIGSPYLITWTGPNGFTSSDVAISNLSKGSYNLTIKDSIGFVFSKAYIITEPSELNLQADTVKNVSCYGAANGEIALLVTGGTPPYKYTWEKDGALFAGSAELKNLGPGTYSVTVTDSANCGPKVATYTITEKPGMSISLINQVNLKCYGDSTGAVSVKVTGGEPIEESPGVFGYDYSWAGPNGYTSTAQNLTHLAGGRYTLTVTDNTGCHQDTVVTIIQPEEITIHVTTTPITCYGDNNASITVDITGGIPPYQIQWSNLGKGTFQEHLSPGAYTVQVTDSNGCRQSKDIVIGEAEFSIRPIVRSITCHGAHDGSIQLNILGSTANVSLVWDDDPTAGVTRNQLGAGTYRVTLKDTSACVIIQSFTIIEPLTLDVSAAITNAFDCSNPNSGAIALTITGGTQPYHVVWSNGVTAQDLSAIQAGTYVATVTDSLGCSLSKQFVVMRPDPIVLSVDTVADFNCQTNVLTEKCTAKITGGMPPYQFAWSSGTVTGLNHEYMETAQSGIVVLGVTDAQGCTGSYTFKVTLPVPGIAYQLINCDTHTYTFNAILPTGIAIDYSFLWDFGDGNTETVQNPQHTFKEGGNYRVTLTLTSPTCRSQFNADITVDPTSVLVLDKLPVFCTGDSIVVHVSGADSYRWDNGSTADSLLIKQPGKYSVTGTSKAGCTVVLPFTATNFDSFNFTIQTDRAEVTTDNPILQLWSESITYSDYFWDFGDGELAEGNHQTHTYNILKDGYYDVKLKVKNPNGCLEFATKRIWIANTSTGNVFTPNGDGVDDVFMKGWHIQVYNRNGILIYEGTEGWDGTFKGKPVSNDTYFYVVYISGASGVKTRTGFITVVR